VHAQVSTNTSLLVTLTPATGQSNVSFAQLTAVVFAGNGTEALPASAAVSFSRNGASIGSARLTPMNSSSTPGTYAGMPTSDLHSNAQNSYLHSSVHSLQGPCRRLSIAMSMDSHWEASRVQYCFPASSIGVLRWLNRHCCGQNSVREHWRGPP